MVSPRISTGLQTEVPLAPYTTIKLGGRAKFFVSCKNVDDIRHALAFAKEKNMRVVVLGGGSNVIVPDSGIDGLVIKIDLKGISLDEKSQSTILNVSAGESWDDVVRMSVEKKLAGIECLSGIPGLAGATPIQNVGAYGQEVKDSIESVVVLDRESGELISLGASECEFGYRSSRFKKRDAGKFVVTEVRFALKISDQPTVLYRELREHIDQLPGTPENSGLAGARSAVLALRRKKSMVVDSRDENSRSVGSFFVNPVLDETKYSEFLSRLKSLGIERAPVFKGPGGVKIPAAWLVEKSGFEKGYRRGGVGISSNHALALVNYSGTAAEVLALAGEIENGVAARFGIHLEKEAVIL